MREKRKDGARDLRNGSEVEGLVLENQRNLLASLPNPAPETAEVGAFVQWKELEGVTINRVYFLCELTAKVIY